MGIGESGIVRAGVLVCGAQLRVAAGVIAVGCFSMQRHRRNRRGYTTAALGLRTRTHSIATAAASISAPARRITLRGSPCNNHS